MPDSGEKTGKIMAVLVNYSVKNGDFSCRYGFCAFLTPYSVCQLPVFFHRWEVSPFQGHKICDFAQFTTKLSCKRHR